MKPGSLGVRARSRNAGVGVRWLLGVALALAAPQPVWAGGPVMESLPVPVRVEREPVRTTMLLQL